MSPTERADRLVQLRAELAQARANREYYDRVATEARDQADEQSSPAARQAFINHATRLRAQAVVSVNRVFELTREIAALESGAEPSPALVAPGVTAEMAAGMDSTMGALA